jgi:hypothetical protein
MYSNLIDKSFSGYIPFDHELNTTPPTKESWKRTVRIIERLNSENYLAYDHQDGIVGKVNIDSLLKTKIVFDITK